MGALVVVGLRYGVKQRSDDHAVLMFVDVSSLITTRANCQCFLTQIHLRNEYLMLCDDNEEIC